MQLAMKDATSIFDVSEKTIHHWIRQGNLPAYCVNEQYRFNRAELLEWATVHKANLSAEVLGGPEPGEGPLPRLDEALMAGGIYYHVEGTDKASVLRAVVDLMHLPPEADRTSLYQVLLARESLGSTAIGDGIAIPHVRHPIVLHILQPTITLCFLDHPIDFGAPDGLPVNVLFTLVNPTVRAHLHLLSKLAFALRDPRFKGVITRGGSPEAIQCLLRRLEEGTRSRPSSSNIQETGTR